MAVRHYRLSLTVDGLVHIGNGNAYGKADYFLDKGKLAILDVGAFVAKLDPGQLDAYCQFLEYEVGAWRGGSGFEEFLDERGDLRRIARESIAYTVDAKLVPARHGYHYYDVKEFLKDAQGRPYVPGSCVKGMLRTALLTCLVLRRRDDYLRRYDPRRVVATGRRRFELTRADRDIMRRAFWREQPDASDRNVLNDVMRYVSVSDSEPLSVGDLVFASKYDKFSELDDGRHKAVVEGQVDRAGNSVNIYRECLRPGTRVSLAIDIDERIEPYLEGIALDVDGLGEVFRRSFELYERCFLDHYEGADDGEGEGSAPAAASDGLCCYVYQAGPLAGMRCRNHAVEGSRYCNVHKAKAAEEAASAPAVTGGVPCYLGGGVDFDSKTIVNALFEDDRRRVGEISRILYAQFPTRIDVKYNGPQAQHLRNLANRVRRAGFDWLPMRAQFYADGRLKKAKTDHRHWQDPELGVSPHTLKYGEWNGQRYLMGRCTLSIEERS